MKIRKVMKKIIFTSLWCLPLIASEKNSVEEVLKIAKQEKSRTGGLPVISDTLGRFFYNFPYPTALWLSLASPFSFKWSSARYIGREMVVEPKHSIPRVIITTLVLGFTIKTLAHRSLVKHEVPHGHLGLILDYAPWLKTKACKK